ncbi:hypothetical protein GCM10012279_27980 [Micromonospora yangpuensis]|nr:hypothetical protein GCM10012279_27980 [Micromonospora yangpuensis]
MLGGPDQGRRGGVITPPRGQGIPGDFVSRLWTGHCATSPPTVATDHWSLPAPVGFPPICLFSVVTVGYRRRPEVAPRQPGRWAGRES